MTEQGGDGGGGGGGTAVLWWRVAASVTVTPFGRRATGPVVAFE